MAAIGERNALRIVRIAPPGPYLDGEELGEILLPGRYAPSGAAAGDYLEVFVHRDSEDRLVATTEIPRACVGEFAALKVVSANAKVGAFLDWGLSKDLFLPLREQAKRVKVGEMVVAFVLLDARSQRIVATTRLEHHLSPLPPTYAIGQRVPLLMIGETPLGYQALIERAHLGLLYKTEAGVALHSGQAIDGYIRAIRPDGKIDLGLDPVGYARIGPLEQQVMEALKAAGGRLPLGDQSSPEAIRNAFGTSKKAFKQALGALYRQQLVKIHANVVELA